MSEAKSIRMEDKQSFLEKFEQCSNEIKQIFTQTRDHALLRCIGTDCGYTNKPDFRFSLGKTKYRNWETYAELLFKRRELLCNLRIDGMNRVELHNSVETIQFLPIPERRSRQGENLVSFAISGNQIADAVSLISQVFAHHLANG